MKRLPLWIALALVGGISPATAATETVLPTDPSWANPPGENNTLGHSEITATAPRSGNGSLELFGGRTRFVGLGNLYDSTSNIGLLSDLTSFTFDWSVAAGSSNPYNADYTPALRLHLFTPSGQRSELIWEGAYNGVYGNMTEGTWYTSGASDNFWQYITGTGAVEIYNRDLTDWQGLYAPGTYIAAISVGVGGGASSNYHAFADNVTLAFTEGSTTYNFEVAGANVPDGASTAALLALSLLGAIGLRRRLSK